MDTDLTTVRYARRYRINYKRAGLPEPTGPRRFGTYPGQVPYWRDGETHKTPLLDAMDQEHDCPATRLRHPDDISL
jgi:hypothetical protein